MTGMYLNQFPKSSIEMMEWIRTTKTPLIMGIINATPDSFYSKSRLNPDYTDLESKIERMIHDGAQILDVGGESSRPGSSYIDEEEELKRVLPIIKAIRKISKIPISIDTRKARVAQQCFELGANFVNDISATEDDPKMIEFIKESQMPLILMHKKGNPKNMQELPKYTDVTSEVLSYLLNRVNSLEKKGIDSKNCIIDPGLGFGKSFEHNRQLISNIDQFIQSGIPVLLGFSRKGMIGTLLSTDNLGNRLSLTDILNKQDYLVHSGERKNRISHEENLKVRDIHDRLAGALALSAFGYWNGVSILRTHDCKETADVIQVLSILDQ
jgi:dihydropteroate synthase